MKKIKFSLAFAILIGLSFSLYFISCTKPNAMDSSKTTSDNSKIAGRPNHFLSSARLSNGHFTCGDTLSGSHTDTGYYMYPYDTLEFSSSPSNTLIQISTNSLNYPNKFSVYDSSGNLIVTTGWMG